MSDDKVCAAVPLPWWKLKSRNPATGLTHEAPFWRPIHVIAFVNRLRWWNYGRRERVSDRRLLRGKGRK